MNAWLPTGPGFIGLDRTASPRRFDNPIPDPPRSFLRKLRDAWMMAKRGWKGDFG